MNLFLSTLAFALACAATAAAQSGRVKKMPVPLPTTPAPREEPDNAQGDGRAATDDADGRTDDEPERDEAGGRVYLGRQVDRKARLLARPEPVYPRRARGKNVQGTVVLRVVLAASGKVEKIAVLKGLPEGLTEEAIRVARRIRFTPAEREGRTVSQSVIIEYNFNLY